MVLELVHRLAAGEETFLWYRFTSFTDLTAEPIQVYAVYNPNKRKFTMHWKGKSWTHYAVSGEMGVDRTVLEYLNR
jgi:hypothetical protein